MRFAAVCLCTIPPEVEHVLPYEPNSPHVECSIAREVAPSVGHRQKQSKRLESIEGESPSVLLATSASDYI